MAYIGTTHAHTGHGPGGGRSRKQWRDRRMIPVRGTPRGLPVRGKTAPWFLKQFGSRPAYKLKRPLEAAA